MQRKCSALVQGLRDAFPETKAWATVNNWAATTIQEVEQLSAQAASVRLAVLNSTYSKSNAEETPANIVQLLQQCQELYYRLFCDTETIATVIGVRVPEHKEEDNLGVAVQMAAFEALGKLQSALAKIDGNDNETSSIFMARNYMATRGKVEERLLGKVSDDGGKRESSRSPSALLELRQVDADAMLGVQLSTARIARLLRSLVTVYVLNAKKLIQPRSTSEHMLT
ncbi:putative Proteasome activator pa28 beta subunit [Trypanosoma vivax]|nr:putative Proteasome activator pa28 beta subunit [Trypanosoma vivax]